MSFLRLLSFLHATYLASASMPTMFTPICSARPIGETGQPAAPTAFYCLSPWPVSTKSRIPQFFRSERTQLSRKHKERERGRRAQKSVLEGRPRCQGGGVSGGAGGQGEGVGAEAAVGGARSGSAARSRVFCPPLHSFTTVLVQLRSRQARSCRCFSYAGGPRLALFQRAPSGGVGPSGRSPLSIFITGSIAYVALAQRTRKHKKKAAAGTHSRARSNPADPGMFASASERRRRGRRKGRTKRATTTMECRLDECCSFRSQSALSRPRSRGRAPCAPWPPA